MSEYDGTHWPCHHPCDQRVRPFPKTGVQLKNPCILIGGGKVIMTANIIPL